MTELAGAETEMRDALRRLRADGVQRLGERVRELVAGWAALQPRRPWDAVDRARLGELAASAHRLAGAGGTFGFPGLSKAAAPLELLLLGLRDTPSPRGDRLRQASAQVEAVAAAWAAGSAGAEEAGDAPGQASQAEHGEPIFLFAEPEEQALLSAVIANLGYGVRRASEREVLEGMLPESRLSAAVIDDAVPDPLAVCRRLAGRCPLILLAEDSSFENRLAAARAGVEALVAKPLEVNELADWLDHFAGARAETRYSIVIVDDDQLLAAAYAMALRQAGMQVTSVSDPAQAIEVIAAAAPDLILMDLQMPGIDGIELARVIRQTRRHLSLPILFLSAEQDTQRQILARRLGGDDFIPKPVDLDRLVTLVRLRAERARSLRAVMESDSLTGLLNHARFKERLVLELERARRHGHTLSLVIFDLDHFKSVNDNYGHLVGDRVIRGLARSLQKRLRRTDVIGRYGGEEFAALLIGTAPAEAHGIIEHLRERFAAASFDTESASFSVTFSAGIAGNAGGVEAEAMISAADAALYAAKRAGRNRVMVAPA
ncbi:diguanylate cyclase [Teichococcus aestuarii]|uniref:diguanylate cyclase n=1 Tax=Teichococcus aestuarii TaxID=568898 RepID=A0A2U1V082_9PROT|nr:diguanylate cyclase [Pseudoroseomonas aestuarii]PWC27320.1 response regulator receiver modulated diguanylate cyclase [Pseudoroseomonas aestuarii]